MRPDQSKRHSSGPRRLGEITPAVVDDAARRATAEKLTTASTGDDDSALRAFREADAIRGHAGQTWAQLLGVGRVNL